MDLFTWALVAAAAAVAATMAPQVNRFGTHSVQLWQRQSNAVQWSFS